MRICAKNCKSGPGVEKVWEINRECEKICLSNMKYQKNKERLLKLEKFKKFKKT